MNAMLKQAQQMQEQMARAQEEAQREVVEATAGGGMVAVKANGGGELVEIRIDPRAIDPDDPELLADMVLAAANEALRTAQAAVEAKLRAQMPASARSGSPASDDRGFTRVRPSGRTLEVGSGSGRKARPRGGLTRCRGRARQACP